MHSSPAAIFMQAMAFVKLFKGMFFIGKKHKGGSISKAQARTVVFFGFIPVKGRDKMKYKLQMNLELVELQLNLGMVKLQLNLEIVKLF